MGVGLVLLRWQYVPLLRRNIDCIAALAICATTEKEYRLIVVVNMNDGLY